MEIHLLGMAWNRCFSLLGFDRAEAIVKMSLKQRRSMAPPAPFVVLALNACKKCKSCKVFVLSRKTAAGLISL